MKEPELLEEIVDSSAGEGKYKIDLKQLFMPKSHKVFFKSVRVCQKDAGNSLKGLLLALGIWVSK